MAVTYTDQQVRQEVMNALQHDVRIDAANITVDVNQGIVHLYGTVPTYFQKVTAGEDTRQIKGVAGVQNDLVVTVVQTFSNQEITDAVRANLDRDVRIANPGNIGISVTNGVVTLTGTVPGYNQKVDAADDAWTAPGVVNVVDDIAVVPPVSRSDAEITSSINATLDHDPTVNPSQVSVNVINGTAYLNGSVPTYYQIQQAANDAWSVAGVVNVVNNLNVSM